MKWPWVWKHGPGLDLPSPCANEANGISLFKTFWLKRLRPMGSLASAANEANADLAPGRLARDNPWRHGIRAARSRAAYADLWEFRDERAWPVIPSN